MSRLAVGDEVLAWDSTTGGLAYKPVYLLGHQDGAASGLFVNIEAAPLGSGWACRGVNASSTSASSSSSSSSASGRRSCSGCTTLKLQLSQQHFLPVCSSLGDSKCALPQLPGLPALLWAALNGGSSKSSSGSTAGWQLRYARDVQPGMRVLVAPGSLQSSSNDAAGYSLEGSPSPAAVVAAVTRVWLSRERGLYNPFVHVSLVWRRRAGHVPAQVESLRWQYSLTPGI